MPSPERASIDLSPSGLSQALALLGVLLYVMGFIVVNVHLATFGVHSLELFKPRYISAGGLVGVILSVFTAFAGQRVYHLADDVAGIASLGMKGQHRALWGVFSLISVLAELGFGIVVAACWVGFLLIDSKSVSPVFYFLTLFFIADYTLLVSLVYKRRAKIALPIAFLFHCTAITIFFYFVTDEAVQKIFWSFVGLSAAFNLLLDLRKRLVVSSSYRLSEGILIVITLLIFTIYFGSSLYGSTDTALGGGKPPIVQLLLTDESSINLKGVITMQDNLSEKVHLLSETAEEIVVMSSDEEAQKPPTLRISKKLLLGVLTYR